MRRPILLWLLIVAAATAYGQNVAFNGFCVKGGISAVVQGLNSTNKLQGIIPSCKVEVFLTGTTTHATIYADSVGTPLSNPFTADALSAVAPGKWLFFAATGQGYDVTLSGGIPPNAYSLPVTLTDLIVGGGGGGSGVTNFSAGNLNPLFNTAVSNPSTTPNLSFTQQNAAANTIFGNFTGTSGPPFFATFTCTGLLSCTYDAGTNIWNVNIPSTSTLSVTSTDPIKVNGGNGPVSSGTANISCPTCGQATLQPVVTPPVGGQYVILYPHTFTVTRDDGSWPISGSADGNNASASLSMGKVCSLSFTTTGVFSGYTLADYGIDPANVTAVYAFAISSVSGQPSSDHCFFTFPGPNVFANASMGTTGSSTLLPPGGYPWNLQQVTSTTTLTGSSIATAQTTVGLQNSSQTVLTTNFKVSSVGLIVYYTGAPITPPGSIKIAPPLTYDVATTTLGVDPHYPTIIHTYTLTNVPSAGSSWGGVVAIQSTTDCQTSSGNIYDVTLCKPVWVSGATYEWQPMTGSGAGSVTSVATGTGLTGGPITTTGTVSCVDATSSTKGCVQVDGTTITASGGVISAAAGGGGLSGQTTNYLPKATSATTSTTSSIVEDQGTGVVIHGTATSHGITVPEATPISGVPTSDVLTADSTTHRWLQNPNNAGATVIAGTSTTAATAGNCVKYAANGYDITDAGAACGSGSGGVTSLNSLTGALNITAGTGITVTPSGSNIQISGSPFGYPSGSRSVWIGNSIFTNNGYTTIAIASGSCTTGTCTYTTSTPHNYQAGQSIGMSGFANSCSNINTTVASTADVYHYVVSGTTCGTTSLATGNSNEITSSVSCTSNVCTITTGNSFSVADDVMINTGFSPSCMAGHVYKAQSGTSSSQIVVDTTGWGACGTTTGTGGIYWDADYSIPGYSCKNEPWFQNLAACDNRAIGGYNLSDIVTNYTSVFHPIIAAAVTAAGSNPVPVFIYANNGSSSALATDKGQWQSLAASLHAEGANVRVIPFTIPTAPCSDPNGIGHTGIALTYQLESSWLLTQTSPDQAPATGQYFDHVISLSGVWNPGMCNSDNIHPNNNGVKNIADKANSEAGLQGVGINQDSCPVGSACYQSGPKYVTDGTNTYSTQWFNGNLNEGTGDPLVTGNYTLVGGVRGGYTTVRGSGCYTWMSDNNPLTTTTDTYLCKNGAGEVDFGTGAGNHAGGASLTFLDMQATTAPTGACTVSGRWEWAKDGTSAWCNGSTWQVVGLTAAFSGISSGTNTTAAMVVGSGASLAPTGTGTIQATNIASTIAAGAGTTITGSGTVASPYTIAVTGSGTSSGTAITVANEGTTGTTLNTLATLTGAPSTAVIAATTDTKGVVGIVTAGAGTTGNATIQTTGLANCVFPAATTAGDYVKISSGTAGNCSDAGATYPTSGQVIGRVLTTNAAGGTYQIDIFPPEIQASSGGGTGATTNITGSVTWTTTGGSSTVSGGMFSTTASGATVITINSIPATYLELQLKCRGSSAAGQLQHLTFNNDGTSHYTYQGQLTQNGTGTNTGYSALNAANLRSGFIGAVTSNFVLDIPAYNQSVVQTGRITTTGIASMSASTNNLTGSWGFAWSPTTPAAITRIDITIESGSYDSGYSCSLYGVN